MCDPGGNYIIPGVKGDIAYSGDLALDAYVQQGFARRPSIVVIHSGAWSSGSRIAHVAQILDVITRAGYNWFSVDYRLGGLTRFEDSLMENREGHPEWVVYKRRVVEWIQQVAGAGSSRP